MQAWPQVVCRVVAEIACQDVVPAVRDIVRRRILIRLGTSGMVIICVAAGHHEADQHRDHEDRDGVKRIDPDQCGHEQYVEKRHCHKCAPNGGAGFTVLKRAHIARHSKLERILVRRHHASIWCAPGRFIFGLIHVIVVVSKIVVQHPDIRDGARLQTKHNLYQPVADL